jgi:hypothetical protein
MVGMDELIPIWRMFQPVTYQIGCLPDPLPLEFHAASQSMFYSMAQANRLRREHEIEGRFEYDWVIKARYDLVFRPGTRWYPRANHQERLVCMGHMDRLPHEYRRLNFSDVMFYGDSWGMDIAADAYFEAAYPTRLSPQDHFCKRGPGTMLAEFLYRNNIACSYVPMEERIIRWESQHMDPARDWNEIEHVHMSYY